MNLTNSQSPYRLVTDNFLLKISATPPRHRRASGLAKLQVFAPHSTAAPPGNMLENHILLRYVYQDKSNCRRQEGNTSARDKRSFQNIRKGARFTQLGQYES